MPCCIKVLSTLAQVFMCCLIDTKPLPEPILIHNFISSNKFLWNWNKITIQENIHENAICKMMAMLRNTDHTYMTFIWNVVVYMEGGSLIWSFVARMSMNIMFNLYGMLPELTCGWPWGWLRAQIGSIGKTWSWKFYLAAQKFRNRMLFWNTLF